MAEFMRNSDAFAWDMEADPRLRSTIVTVLLLDRSPDFATVVERFDRLSRAFPMFRQKIVTMPRPAPPRWVVAPDFDIRFHVRRVTAPAPATLDTVLEMARRAEMAGFDPVRPLWEATVVEGLADGGAALLCKLHHSLMDGIGGVQIAMVLFDQQEQPGELGPLPAAPEAESAGPLTGVVKLLGYDAGLARAVVTRAAGLTTGTLVGSVLHPRRTVRSGLATAASVYRTVRPLTQTASPLMKDRTLRREVAVHEVSLSALKEAAHRSGGTLNDAFLAGVTAALRRYHEAHGAAVGDLWITMPISVRGASDPQGGNRITLLRTQLPVGLADAAERIREIHRRAQALRGERSLPLTQSIAGALNLLPRWYVAGILRHVDFLASDVPGIPVPVFLAGAPVRIQYAFGPTIGSGVNVTLMTYVDTCALGITADTGAIPDFEVFRQCLVAGFDEVLALAPAQAQSWPSSRSSASSTVPS